MLVRVGGTFGGVDKGIWVSADFIGSATSFAFVLVVVGVTVMAAVTTFTNHG